MAKENKEGAANTLLECVQQVSLADVQAMPLQQWFVLGAAAVAVATPIFGLGYGLGRNKEKGRTDAALRALSTTQHDLTATRVALSTRDNELQGVRSRLNAAETENRDLRDPARPSDRVVAEELQKARAHAEELQKELSSTLTRLTEYDRLRMKHLILGIQVAG